jgi:hypothetical protein
VWHLTVLLRTSALVGPLHIVNWNARWKREVSTRVWLHSIDTCNAWECLPFLFLTSSLNVAENSERVLTSLRLIQFFASQCVERWSDPHRTTNTNFWRKFSKLDKCLRDLILSM